MADLKGRTALVTGASSGIGEAIARELAGMGADVILVARREDRLRRLADELRGGPGVEVHVMPADLAVPNAAADLVEQVRGAGLAVDVLINNAGFGHHQDFLASDWERQLGMMQVNMVTLTHLTHLMTPAMVERGWGHVMNVASIGAFLPVPGFALYSATKAYVRNFTEGLDAELAGSGVHAIAVCPGGTRTEFMEVAGESLSRIGQLASMSSERCARIAVARMLAGRRLVVTGYSNAWGMWSLRWVPRFLMTFIGKHVLGATFD
jgi:uncharacterized protein